MFRKYRGDSSIEVKEIRDVSDDSTDDVTDSVFVEFNEVDRGEPTEGDRGETLRFELSYMDSPYIDNMSFFQGYRKHHKLAFVLKEIDEVKGEYKINIDVVHFPGKLIPTYRAKLPKSVADDKAEDASHNH